MTIPESLLESISCWIDMVQPQVTVTFRPDGVSGRPDHMTISNVVTQVYDQCYKKGILLYIHPSEATVLGCGDASTGIEDTQSLVEVDISDDKLEKIRVIQGHTSQNPDLIGIPEDVTHKVLYSEFYTVARDMKTKDNYPYWFETNREEATIAI